MATLVAQHSDIQVLYDDGAFLTDRSVYFQDIRENGLSNDGTIWATDNPGFAGSGLKFRSEFYFDVVGPLRHWTGARWSADQIGLERIRFFQPTPFGEAVNSVSVDKETVFEEGFLIQRANTLGRIHQHFTFELSAGDGERPTRGAYAFEMTVRSPNYGVTPPFTLVFNNGLSEEDLASALVHLSKIRVTRIERGRIGLAWDSLEGTLYQVQSKSAISGVNWEGEGDARTGTGEVISIEVSLDEPIAAKFYRVVIPGAGGG